MNCFVEIGEISYPGHFLRDRGGIYDVQMAGQNGYDFVIGQMNTPGRILIPATGAAYHFTRLLAFAPDRMEISLQ